MDDSEKTQVYNAAIDAAMAEYRALRPQAIKINERLRLLRGLVWHASNLIGRNVEEEFDPTYPGRLRAQQIADAERKRLQQQRRG